MLVLTRKAGEKVRIGDNIFLEVVGIKGNQVRLGFRAPQDVIIRRQEICFELCDNAAEFNAASCQEPLSV